MKRFFLRTWSQDSDDPVGLREREEGRRLPLGLRRRQTGSTQPTALQSPPLSSGVALHVVFNLTPEVLLGGKEEEQVSEGGSTSGPS